jgi:hypothetical protein
MGKRHPEESNDPLPGIQNRPLALRMGSARGDAEGGYLPSIILTTRIASFLSRIARLSKALVFGRTTD